MQVNQLKYNIYCIFNIKIEHISSSKTDLNWIKNSKIFYTKWKSYLPIGTISLSFRQFIHVNLMALKIGFNIYKSNNIKYPRLQVIRKSQFLKLTLFFFLN